MKVYYLLEQKQSKVTERQRKRDTDREKETQRQRKGRKTDTLDREMTMKSDQIWIKGWQLGFRNHIINIKKTCQGHFIKQYQKDAKNGPSTPKQCNGRQFQPLNLGLIN